MYSTQAAYRRETLVIALFYSLWPRLTLIYTYLFHYYDIFLPFMHYHYPSHREREVVNGGGSEEEEAAVSGGRKVGQVRRIWCRGHQKWWDWERRKGGGMGKWVIGVPNC